MSVYRPTKGSDYVVDREFLMDGVLLRIKATTWTSDHKEALRREALLVELHRGGQFELLRALKEGDITVLDLVAAKLERRLWVPDAHREITDRRNLWDVLASCIELGSATERTKGRYRLSLKKLRGTGVLGADATMRTLTAVNWTALKAQWVGSGSDWNHMVRMLSHALTLYYGDVFAPQRRRLMAKIPKAREPRARMAVLSLELFRRMVAKTPPHVRAVYWTLLLTAMRAGEGGEYFRSTVGHLDADELLVRVPGTKTTGSAAAVAVHPDDWHWVAAGIPAPRQYRWVREHWKRAARACGRPEIRLHDIRHLSIRLALDGGASLSDAQAHARHDDPKMTMDYARIEQSRRAADAIRLALSEPTTRPTTRRNDDAETPEDARWALQGSNLRPSDYEEAGGAGRTRPAARRPQQKGKGRQARNR